MPVLLHAFSRAIVIVVALPAASGVGTLPATDGLVLLQQRVSRSVTGGAQQPLRDIVRFLKSKAREHGTARRAPNSTSTGDMSDATVQTSPAENSSLDQQTPGSGWCGYHAKEGWATLYVDPADPMSFLVDVTKAMKQSTDGSVKMLVTAMATKGLYLDDFGQIITLHEPLEQTEHNLLEMKATDDGYYVDVVQPQIGLRTSDPQEEKAVEMGVPSKLWQASMERLYCTSGYDEDDMYDAHRKGDDEGETDSLNQDSNSAQRFQPRKDVSVPAGSSLDEPIVFDGMELLARGFFVSQGLIAGVSDYRLLSVKSFPNNFDITVELRYESPDPSIPSFPMTVTFSVTALPETPMAARHGDERLGYFTTNYKDLGRHAERRDQTRSEARDTDVSMIWRYDLNRIGNQIRIHIDPTVPSRYRQCFRDGIEAWNEAFELLGNASAMPEVKGVAPGDPHWPQDYDAGDARFNTISWSIDEDAVYSEGIARVDQRSGEIIKADIIMTGGWVRAWMGDLDRFTPTHHTQHLRRGYRREFMRLRELSEGAPSHNGSAPDAKRSKGVHRSHPGRVHEALLARARVLSSSVPLEDRKEEEEVLCDGLKDVVMHEMGLARRARILEELETDMHEEVVPDLETKTNEETISSKMEELEGTKTWCSHKDTTLECKHGQVLKLRTAFYNHFQQDDCTSPPDAKEVRCSPKAVAVIKACTGKQVCSIPASFHTSCPENPFTFIRVRYECEDGEDATKKDLNQDVANAVKELTLEKKDQEETFQRGTKKEQAWCTSLPEKLFCENGEVIEVRTAFYNRSLLKACNPSGHEDVPCSSNSKDRIAKLCNGRTECELQPGQHPSCAGNPFTFLRVVYKCGEQRKAVIQAEGH